MSDLIEATSVRVQTMADDSLRLTIDISPIHADDAFSLFGKKGVPMVLARLTQEASIKQAQEQTIEKGGFLSQWLAMRCNEPQFWEFIDSLGHVTHEIANSSECDHYVKKILEIDSKKEIDNDQEVEARFHNLIRGPYKKWLVGVR
jgi:hypothetical protein